MKRYRFLWDLLEIQLIHILNLLYGMILNRLVK